MDEVFWAATVVAAPLIHLGIFDSPCQAYHELFYDSLDSSGIIILLVLIATGVLFFHMGQIQCGHLLGWLVAFEFPQREETGSPWIRRSISCLSPGASGQLHGVFLLSLIRWPLGSPNKSLPVGLPSGMPPLLLVSWGVCCKSGLSSTLPLNQGESSQGKKAAGTWRCLERQTPQSNTVSLPAICN